MDFMFLAEAAVEATALIKRPLVWGLAAGYLLAWFTPSPLALVKWWGAKR